MRTGVRSDQRAALNLVLSRQRWVVRVHVREHIVYRKKHEVDEGLLGGELSSKKFQQLVMSSSCEKAGAHYLSDCEIALVAFAS